MEILASIELGRRITIEKTYRKQLLSAIDIFDEYKHDLEYNTEHFLAIYFDSKCHVICTKELFKGDIKSTILNPSEIFKYAIKIGAPALAVLHNHPTGDPTPSKADIEFTESLKDYSSITDIALLDHIIVGDYYYSFNEDGKI